MRVHALGRSGYSAALMQAKSWLVVGKTDEPAKQLQLPGCTLAADGRSRRHCRLLVALYDTERARIVYRNTLDMRDPTDQSFIVHELVHHLQFLVQGDELFATCRSTMAAEEQAYRAQSLYQKHFRQWQRMGEVMRFMNCEDRASSEPLVRITGSPVGPPDR
jgi:hypothetical protein